MAYLSKKFDMVPNNHSTLPSLLHKSLMNRQRWSNSRDRKTNSAVLERVCCVLTTVTLHTYTPLSSALTLSMIRVGSDRLPVVRIGLPSARDQVTCTSSATLCRHIRFALGFTAGSTTVRFGMTTAYNPAKKKCKLLYQKRKSQ